MDHVTPSEALTSSIRLGFLSDEDKSSRVMLQ